MATNVAGIAAVSFGAAIVVARTAIPKRHRALLNRIGKREGVSPNVLHAIGWKESALDASAIGPPNRNGTRDYGLMQINESNFAKLGLDTRTALDAETNVTAAARLIREIAVVNGKWLPDLFSVYNAGPSRVASRLGGPKRNRRGEYVNQGYVSDVTARYVAVALGYPLGV